MLHGALHGASPAPPLRWVLVYAGVDRQGAPAYTTPELTRLVTHVDSAGDPEYWLCTGAIFLHLYAPSGHVFTTWIGGTPANGVDWAAYLDSLFLPGAALQRLDSAVALASGQLGPRAFPVALMIPYPEPKEDTLRFAGVRYDLRTVPGRVGAAGAYVAEAERRFQAAGLRHVNLDGFYWLLEKVPSADVAVVGRVAQAVHARGLRFLWIPFYDAKNWDRWRELGFDEAWLQPNYFFHLHMSAKRLEAAATRAERAGMGLELELDGRLLSDARFAGRLDPYLDALEKHPRLRERAMAIYDGEGTLPLLSRSQRPVDRQVYRRLGEVLR